MLKLPLFLALTLPAFAHHGQDFLVTIDAGVSRPWELRTTFGGEYSDYSPDYESSLTQSIILGLPQNFTFINILRFADEGSGSWNSFSTTPILQWTAPDLNLKGSLSSLRLAIAGGWEIPINRNHGHSHDHGALPQTDCSGLIAIPPLYQACQLGNQSAARHSHDDNGHGHNGIHRHGESHGFLRLIAELNPTPRDRFVLNTIAVFPKEDSVQWGYALAYRHRFTPDFAMGLEATGDMNLNGQHQIFLTGTNYVSEQFSYTVGAAAGLTENSPDMTVQALVSWRF